MRDDEHVDGERVLPVFAAERLDEREDGAVPPARGAQVEGVQLLRVPRRVGPAALELLPLPVSQILWWCMRAASVPGSHRVEACMRMLPHPFSEVRLFLEWHSGMLLQYDLCSLLTPACISHPSFSEQWIRRPYLGCSVEIAAERLLEGNAFEGIGRQLGLFYAGRVELGVELALHDALPVLVRLSMADDVDPDEDRRRRHRCQEVTRQNPNPRPGIALRKHFSSRILCLVSSPPYPL